MSDELEVITDKQWQEKFVLIHRLKGEARALRVQTQQSQSQFGLTFEIEQHGKPVRLAVLTGRQTLLDLARQILDSLDPVTNEQVLEKLRKLLEDRG